MGEFNEFWEAIRTNVCSHCIDSDGHGICRLPEATACGLKRYFPAIVNTVLSVQSDNLGPYVKALRENVCTVCEHQTVQGGCLVRSNIDCGLDRYFPMVVESIESFRVDGKDSLASEAGYQ